MKKISIFIIVIMMLVAVPFICKAVTSFVVPLKALPDTLLRTTSIDVLGDNIFEWFREAFLYGIIKDMSFLEKTKPTSWEAMLEDLHKLKYADAVGPEEDMDISNLYEGEGDCEDFAMYTVARLFQLDRIPGILILAPINPGMRGHIVAITLSLDKNSILIIDATKGNKENYVTDIKEYLPEHIMSGYYRACRLMWFHRGSIPSSVFTKKEKDN